MDKIIYGNVYSNESYRTWACLQFSNIICSLAKSFLECVYKQYRFCLWATLSILNSHVLESGQVTMKYHDELTSPLQHISYTTVDTIRSEFGIDRQNKREDTGKVILRK